MLKDELEMNMRLIGARNIEELDESMVDTRALATHIGTVSFEFVANRSACTERHAWPRCLRSTSRCESQTVVYEERS